MPFPKRILLTGGGTAGHVNPALAIGSALKGPGTETLFVGIRGRAEEQVVPREGVPIHFVRASAWPGAGPSVALFRFAAETGIGTLQAAAILLKFRPDVVIGTGGYVAAPVVLAAALLRRLGLLSAPVYLHEQNAVPGRLNLLAGRLATKVFVSFPGTLREFPANGVLAGYPLRRRIARISREEARRGLDFAIPEGRKVVFAFGGSLGARTINRALVDALRPLLPHREKIFLIHGVGLSTRGEYDADADTGARLAASYTADEREAIAGFYVSRPYFHDIERVYAVADLVVGRGGAGTLSELATVGLPAIVVPKVNLPGDHQVANARALEKAGGAEVLYEETVEEEGRFVEKLDGALLARRILALAFDPERLSAMAAASRAFLVRDPLGTIEAVVLRGEDPGELEARDGIDAPAPDASSSNALLLDRLSRGMPPPEECERTWYVSRAASLLSSPEWEQRNVGVKLLGLLGAKEKAPLLVALLRDRRPAPVLQRLFGGDFLQVGFVRRNAVASLGRLAAEGPDVEEVLLAALDDPYYEVRAEAARVLAAAEGRIARRADFGRVLARATNDESFEAAAAAAEALGRLGEGATALPALLSLSERRWWKLRSSALVGILSLVERGEVADLAALSSRLAAVPLTSTDFAPQFELKATYRRLVEAVSRRQEGER